MIIGVDEVGRGSWAGPVVAAAVGLSQRHKIIGLNDSKLLSAKKRLELNSIIRRKTKIIGLGWVWPSEINKFGLTESVRLAMQRAIQTLNTTDCIIVIDGNYNYLKNLPNSKAVIKADGSVSAVSAASIIAKVARDTYMQQIAKKYPNYGFERHVGYGTRFHNLALLEHGVSDQHRLNFKPIKALLV